MVRRLREVGCTVELGGRSEATAGGRDLLTVTPPSWRPDLTDPNDLAEEVIRLEGYEKIGIAMPRATAGQGPDGRAAAARRDRPGAGRGRLRRGAEQPVRLGGRLRPAPAAARGSAGGEPSCWPTRSGTRNRCCGPRCCPACSGWLAATPGADSRTCRCSRSGTWPGSEAGRRRQRPSGHGAASRVAPILPVDRGPTAGGDRRAGAGAARSAPAGRRRADRPPGRARLVGRGPAGQLPGRDRGRARRAADQPGAVLGPGRPARAVASGPVRGVRDRARTGPSRRTASR